MANPKLIAYQRLKDLYEEAESVIYEWKSSKSDTEWRQNVQSALKRLFNEDNQQLDAFEAVFNRPFFCHPMSPNAESLIEERFYDDIKSANAVIRSAIKDFEDYELDDVLNEQSQLAESDSNQRNSLTRKIFVVHGHDNEMKLEVARFLERIDFEPIILHEQASAGDTIIEKFERNADVSYAVVLLSPDDVGAVKDKQDSLQPRARQNVVLELGYFIGKLGRTHVFPLVRQSVEIPSDFSGVVYVPFEGDSWKMRLIQELKHLGFEIDANKAFA